MMLLAQEGSQAAAQVIADSLKLSKNIITSWDDLWQTLLQSPDKLSLWTAIVQFSLTLSILALIYFAIQNGNDIMNSQSLSKIIQMFVTPLVVVFLLGGNGYMLANIILMLRGVGRSLIFSLLSLQLAGLSIDKAIIEVNSNMYAMQRIRQVFQECAALTGKPLTDCLTSKQAEAETIVNALSADVPVRSAQLFLSVLNVPAGSPIGTARSFIQGGFTQVIQDNMIPIIQSILYAIQWAFVNILEASLLLSALFAPIAVALLLLPVAGNALSAWLCSFMGILGIQLGYNILVGLVAVVLATTDRQSANAIGAAGNFGFLIFISIFSPYLATQIGRGGGTALYEGISRKAAAVGGAVVQVISSGVKLAAGGR